LGNVAVERRAVESDFELLNKEAVDVQKRALQVAETGRGKETWSHAAWQT
jgi:hypothetical protein